MADNEKNPVAKGLEEGVKKTAGFFDEFKKFISKGSVIDMAVGVIVGSSFSAIVNSLVGDILSPVLSLLTHKINFSDLKIVLAPAAEGMEETAILYGTFIENVINFLFQAFAIFILVKAINKFREKIQAEELAAAKEKEEAEKAEKEAAEEEAKRKADEPVQLLREILEAVKKQ